MKIPRNHHTFYALAGALLGMGAPIGALALRLFLSDEGALRHCLIEEWTMSSYFYIYMTVGTMTAFSLFGFFLGKKGDALEWERTQAAALAITDGLTGLYNHRYLQQHLAAEFERAQRYHTPLTCFMLDIDNFKFINDTYGHLNGDEVLRVTSRIMKEQVRRVDTAGRYGGEEFLILMPHTTCAEAFPVAERIRNELQDFPFRFTGQNVHVTLSIGGAMYDPSTELPKDKKALLQAADETLYQAKRNGKNQTIISRV